MSTVDTIKERLSITEVIESYIKLEKAGANLKGLCPFHHEKTPSFFVSPSRNSYYCFGCNAKGDVFSFVEQYEGVDFMGALKILADRAGVEIVKENPKAKTEKERILKAIEYAVFFYHKELSGNVQAREYLTKRGVSIETMKKWQLGYAPTDWRSLHTFLTSKGFSGDELVLAGLVKKGDKGYYDVFRSRIMFPIADTSGRVVAFSGRIFPDEKDVAKYLNTPETPLFNKSAILYGYNLAKMSIRTKNKAILVEGQMDLILSHQSGIDNSIATSGTAFTELHAQAIKRFAPSVTICFDGDTAGINAALRASAIALGQGLEVKIAQLPEGTDPADLAVTQVETYKNSLEDAVSVVEFALKMVLAKTNDSHERGRLVVKDVLPYIKSMTSSVEQSYFVRLVASRTLIREEALWDELKKTRSLYTQTDNPVEVKKDKPKNQNVESQLFGILFLLESNLLKSVPVDASSLEERLKNILGTEVFERLKIEFQVQRQELLLRAEITYDSPKRLTQDIDEFCYRLEEENIKQKYTKTMQALSQAEIDNDQTKIKELLEYCKELSNRLSIIHKEKK